MHRLKRPDADLRVYLRGFDAAVPQHCLYPSEVRAVLQHLGRHCMPEQVAAPFLYPRCPQVRHYRVSDAVRRQARHTVHRQEQRLTLRADQEFRPHPVQVMPQHEQDVIRELLDAMIIKNQVTGAVSRVTQGAAKEES